MNVEKKKKNRKKKVNRNCLLPKCMSEKKQKEDERE
jgi:hypothetical protein